MSICVNKNDRSQCLGDCTWILRCEAASATLSIFVTGSEFMVPWLRVSRSCRRLLYLCTGLPACFRRVIGSALRRAHGQGKDFRKVRLNFERGVGSQGGEQLRGPGDHTYSSCLHLICSHNRHHLQWHQQRQHRHHPQPQGPQRQSCPDPHPPSPPPACSPP